MLVSCPTVNSSPIVASQVAEEEMPPPKKVKPKQKQKWKGGKRRKVSIPSRKKNSVPVFEPPGVQYMVSRPEVSSLTL